MNELVTGNDILIVALAMLILAVVFSFLIFRIVNLVLFGITKEVEISLKELDDEFEAKLQINNVSHVEEGHIKNLVMSDIYNIQRKLNIAYGKKEKTNKSKEG